MGGSRTFRVLVIGFLVTLLVLGIAIRSVTIRSMTNSALKDLEHSSLILSQLAAAYYADGSMANMQFIINLDLASEFSGTDVLLYVGIGVIALLAVGAVALVAAKKKSKEGTK